MKSWQRQSLCSKRKHSEMGKGGLVREHCHHLEQGQGRSCWGQSLHAHLRESSEEWKVCVRTCHAGLGGRTRMGAALRELYSLSTSKMTL